MKKIIIAIGLLLGSLSAVNAQTTIKNGGLENWRTSKLLFNLTTTLETPQGWSSFDSIFNIFNFLSGQNTRVTTQVKKSTAIKNSGLSSAQVTTGNYSDLGLMPGYLTNAKLTVDANFDFNFSGGEVLASKPIIASAMVNYKPATVYDSANLYVEVINTTLGVDSIIGYGTSTFAGTTNFTQIDIPIFYEDKTLTANLLRYYFVSSYVDDVTYTTVKSETYALMSEMNVACYPNPTTDVITVTAAKGGNSLVCELYSATGQLMLSKPFNGSTAIQVSDWSAGVYTYQVKDKSNVIVGHGQLAVVRP
ncbi:MAG: T9SS type A sorting domain-containing protein [Bacteroidetes bacterium]|nr:T9SS type A sorting domain-containing protein [Bacteroidota bacterium]